MTDDAERASRGGWVFETPDPVFGCADLRQVYDAASPEGRYIGRCTAPVLVDARTQRIVSNESADIVRMLNGFDVEGSSATVDLYPPSLQAEIDALNDWVYREVSNGVYRCGFATTQDAYDVAARELRVAMDALEARLGDGRAFLLGARVTEADVRLLPTVVRYDAVYAGVFKCGAQRIRDLPGVHAWMRRMWALPTPPGGARVSETFDVDAARRSYYGQLFPLNPGGIVPAGPDATAVGLEPPPRDDAAEGGEELASAREGCFYWRKHE